MARTAAEHSGKSVEMEVCTNYRNEKMSCNKQSTAFYKIYFGDVFSAK